MAHNVRILVVDDEPGLREILSKRLEFWGFECRAAADVGEAERALEVFEPDLVLSDVVMPGATGLQLLRRLKAGKRRRLPVVLMTAHGTVDVAVGAMKEGAEDFLIKPVDEGKLRAVIDAVVADLVLAREARKLDAALEVEDPAVGLVGRSPAMLELKRMITLIGARDASVLISGESGTGKEIVARAIHAASPRRDRPFVPINAAAIPETLIESELFGHEKGAFTGAGRSRAGCFEQANTGTLFLDELAEMPMSLQPKLLRILEDGRVRRLGGSQEIPVDTRVIAATNRSPAGAIRDGRLREDLFYRLNVFELVVPPLRERRDDLPLLCHAFLRDFNEKHRTDIEGLRDSALECLRCYSWPGNVRELRNLMERAVIVSRSRWLEPAHFPAYIRGAEPMDEPTLVVPIGTPVAEAERQLILRTLDHVGQNKAEAARQLGLDVKTIRNKLKNIAAGPEEG
ncbi:MAG: sigma-54 dependent transcriptional regulator [Gemmatimonadota bacterium]|jgi:DNA-binding NtrC family response regulator|nr:sigma-54 dependent transcriptional regulator [Gemmatimonadota bacterium]